MKLINPKVTDTVNIFSFIYIYIYNYYEMRHSAESRLRQLKRATRLISKTIADRTDQRTRTYFSSPNKNGSHTISLFQIKKKKNNTIDVK